MSLVVAALLWAIAALLAVVVIVLCLPWCVAVSAVAGDRRRVRVEVRPVSWALPFVVRIDTARSGPHGAATEPRTARAATAGTGTSRPERRKRRRGGFPAQRALSAAPRLISGVLRCIHLDFLHLSGRVGLDDPADTGRLFGMVYPLAWATSGQRISVEVIPAFDAAALEGEAAAGLRVVPAALLIPVARFAWEVFARPSWA